MSLSSAISQTCSQAAALCRVFQSAYEGQPHIAYHFQLNLKMCIFTNSSNNQEKQN